MDNNVSPSSAINPSATEPTVRLSVDAAFEVARKHHAAGRLPPAERIYNSILQTMPKHAGAIYFLGVMALQLDRRDIAEQRFRAVLSQIPGHVDAMTGLASALHELGQSSEAEQLARRAIQSDGSSAPARSALGRILLHRGRHAEATDSYERAVALDPRNAPLMTSLLYCMVQDGAVDPERLARAHRAFGKKFGAGLHDKSRPHLNTRDPDRRLRVGFVSGDLRRHAVAYFIEPVWQELNGNEVEVFAYSNLLVEDEVSRRLKLLVQRWAPVYGLDDKQLAEQIRSDQIDILVDLSGHTVRNRLLAFARKPAPVQASWIGYPESTGLTAMDYFLADPFSVPPGALDAFYVEKLVRLPAGSAFQPDPASPDVNPLPALQRGYVTFGAFNRLSKVGPPVIETWSQVMQAVPRSRLLMANVGDEATERDLMRRFAEHGVTADRLTFAPRLPLRDYFRLHHDVDVLLDTFPYTGGTTTQHALWMGVPVITLAGLRRSERIGTANLSRVGLEDWSVTSRDAYVARAVRAAADLDGLAALRAGLRERMRTSPLRQASTVARSLEFALRAMWRRWCDGLPPQAFAVTLEQALAHAPKGRSE